MTNAASHKSVKVAALKNAPKNHKLISQNIQKDIVSAVAAETPNAIISELGDVFFFCSY